MEEITLGVPQMKKVAKNVARVLMAIFGLCSGRMNIGSSEEG